MASREWVASVDGRIVRLEDELATMRDKAREDGAMLDGLRIALDMALVRLEAFEKRITELEDEEK